MQDRLHYDVNYKLVSRQRTDHCHQNLFYSIKANKQKHTKRKCNQRL